MMPIDLLLAQSKKTRGIVVEDVFLLLGSEKGSALDVLYRRLDGARPDHLVGAEQDGSP